MARKKKHNSLPEIPSFLDEKEEKALIEAFNFIAGRCDCKEHAERINSALKPLGKKMVDKGCDGTLNNMMMCFLSRLQGYNVGISYRYYLDIEED